LTEDADAAGVRATSFKVAPDGATLAVISRLLESGDVKVFVDQVFDLTEVAKAHTALETGHTRGKIVLNVSGG
jgi:NADPH:quinone reductase-like Zn-dependent oxidoreductase